MKSNENIKNQGNSPLKINQYWKHDTIIVSWEKNEKDEVVFIVSFYEIDKTTALRAYK